uniref:Reverse transcriptase domain-containing protein n=1 Tax=Leptobrachium leishanense TaxID=445787 RepID=A0A8C5PNQ6_9ANUR
MDIFSASSHGYIYCPQLTWIYLPQLTWVYLPPRSHGYICPSSHGYICPPRSHGFICPLITWVYLPPAHMDIYIAPVHMDIYIAPGSSHRYICPQLTWIYILPQAAHMDIFSPAHMDIYIVPSSHGYICPSSHGYICPPAHMGIFAPPPLTWVYFPPNNMGIFAPAHKWVYLPPAHIGSLKSESGVLLTEDQDKAEILNDYFSSVFIKEKPITGDMQFINKNLLIQSDWLTQDKVLQQLNKVHVNKAPGPDGIHPRVLRELYVEICKPLFLIFQDSFLSGIVPEYWRKADMVPIFKKGLKCMLAIYRPVSLTSVAGKVFEGLRRDNIQEFIGRYNVIGKNLYGFMKHRSCQTNLIAFYEEVSRSKDQEVAVDVIYLDFAKAFDTVPHKRLLFKLRKIGLDKNSCSWIENWIKDRVQRVFINGTFSRWTSVVSGVPRGSVIGPILLNLFISDLEIGIESHESVFADDTKLGKVIQSEQDVTSLQRDLDRLGYWALKWQMKFNVDKCKVMHFGVKNTQATFLP